MRRAQDFAAVPTSDGDKSPAQSGDESPHSKTGRRLAAAARRWKSLENLHCDASPNGGCKSLARGSCSAFAKIFSGPSVGA
jgi:hypothetical protein